MELLEAHEALLIDRLKFKDNFKAIPWDEETNIEGKKCLTRENLTIKNYYKGTAVQWCLPFRTNINKSNLKVEKDESSGNLNISYLDPNSIHEHDSNGNDDVMKFTESTNANKDPHKAKCSTLLVGDNFLYLTDSNAISRILGGITDCAVFSYKPNLAPTDILLVIQKDGTLMSLIPQKYGYPLQQFQNNSYRDSKHQYSLFSHKVHIGRFPTPPEFTKRDAPLVLQHLKLKPSQNWKLIKHPKNNKDFIVADFKCGIFNFYKFTSQFHFEFIETFRFDCNKVVSCYFLPADTNKVFISLILASRMSHFYIEWDDDTPKMVYKLNHPNCQSMKCSIPVGPDSITLCSNKKIILVTTKQIVSGDTNYVDFENNILRGVKSWFEDPTLTSKLINMINLKQLFHMNLSKDTKCTIVLTSTSVVYAIFISEEHKQIYLVSLGRFKELRDVYSDINQDDAKEHSHMLVASIINRTIRLELDLNNIKHIPFSSKQLPTRKPVENKHTISSNSDINNFKIAHVNDRNEVWLAGNSSISQLSDNSIIPLRKSKTIGKFHHSFKNYQNLKVLETVNFFTGYHQGHLQGIHGDGSFHQFIFDDERQDFKKEENKSSKEPILFYRDYPTHSIKVTKDLVTCIINKSVQNILSPECEITGVQSLKDRMIVWSESGKKVWLLSDIDDFEAISSKPTKCFADTLETTDHFSFYFRRPQDDYVPLILRTSKGFFNTSWNYVATVHKNCNVRNPQPLQKFSMLPNGLFCFSDFNDPAQIVYGMEVSRTETYRKFHALVECANRSNFTIKCLSDEKRIAIIYSDRLYLITFKLIEKMLHQVDTDKYSKAFIEQKNDNVVSIEEVKLPHLESHKTSYLMDVESLNYNGRELLCLLYDSGMQCIELTYKTWNKTDFLLHNTKSKNKLFTYLKNLNRMLVANCDSWDWYLMNLETGKIKLLDNIFLEDSGEMIQNIIEIPNNDSDSNKCSAFIIIFHTQIKCMRISFESNDLVTEVSGIFEFEGNLHKEYGLCKNWLTLLEIENDKEIFHRFKINEKDGSIELINSFSIKSRSPTRHFAAGPDYLVLIGKVKDSQLMIMLHHTDTFNGPLTHNNIFDFARAYWDRYPAVRKLYQLTDQVVAMVLEQGNTLYDKSQILLLPMTHLYKGSRIFRRDAITYDDSNVICFWDYMRKNISEIWENELDEICDVEFYQNFEYVKGPFDLFNTIIPTSSKIDLDKNVLDLNYTNGVLNVLCHDQSLVQFGLSDTQFDMKRGAIESVTDNISEEDCASANGYFTVTTDSYVVPMESHELDPYLSYIDPWGRRALR